MVQGIEGIAETTGATFSAQASQLTNARQNGFQAAAQSLGLSASDLRQALANGQSITELAVAQGQSTSDLTSAVEAAIKKQLPSATNAQVSSLASRIVEGARGQQHRGARAYSGSATGSSDESAGEEDQDEASGHIHLVL